MKRINLVWVLSLLILAFASCKDNEREVENDMQVQEENFEERVEELRGNEDLYNKVAENPQLSTFATGMKAWNVNDSLEMAQKPVIIFAPNNDAYSEIYQQHGQELVSSDSDAIIAYHVVKSGVEGKNLKQQVQNAQGGLKLMTMQGEEMNVSLQNDQLTLTGGNNTTAKVVDSIAAENGTIYITDGVLLPNGIDLEVVITAD